MKCPYCKEEVNALYINPFTVINAKSGEEVKDVMCRMCLEFTLEEVSPYGNDCPSGRCEM